MMISMPRPVKSGAKSTGLARLVARTLLDGAVGTELIARGLKVGVDCPEAWNLDRPEDVKRIHRAYFEAGADVVTTNSFGGNRMRLGTFGRQADVRKLNRAAALLAKEVCPPGKSVIGSIGPTGGMPPPDGNVDLIELEDAFAEQAMALDEGGVDLIHIETQYHPKEARAAIRGVRAGAPRLAVVASLSCRVTSTGYITHKGYPADILVSVFLEENVEGVGINCTLAPAQMLDWVRRVRARTAKPIFAKPTIAPSGSAPLLPDELATGALALWAAGATCVGGCCGAGPADIRAVRKALDGEAAETRSVPTPN